MFGWLLEIVKDVEKNTDKIVSNTLQKFRL